jgi:glycosyltransferase involved in cell wall biosynthesis
MPDLTSMNVDDIAKHDRPERIEILFVANAARDHGLPSLLGALRALPPPERARVHLTIVSRFADGPVPIELGDVSYTVRKGAPHHLVMRLMRQAHIVANPSSFETYGFVFIEGMASGAVPIGPAWEAQRELLDGGRRGALLPHDGGVSALRDALARLIADDAARVRMAQAGLEAFEATFSPSVVGPQLVSLLLGASAEA